MAQLVLQLGRLLQALLNNTIQLDLHVFLFIGVQQDLMGTMLNDRHHLVSISLLILLLVRELPSLHDEVVHA